MTSKELKEMLASLDLPPSEKFVLLILALHARDNGSCWPSTFQLCKLTGLSRASIQRILSNLEKQGLISRSKGRQNRNVYQLASLEDMSHDETCRTVRHVSKQDMSHDETCLKMRQNMSHDETTDVSQCDTFPPNNPPTIEGAIEGAIEGKSCCFMSPAHPQNGQKSEKLKGVSSVFEIPDIEEVKGYAVTIGLPEEEAERFFDYYSARGWELKNGQVMRDWRAAMRNWKRNWMEREQVAGKANKPFKPNPWWGLVEPGSEQDQKWQF